MPLLLTMIFACLACLASAEPNNDPVTVLVEHIGALYPHNSNGPRAAITIEDWRAFGDCAELFQTAKAQDRAKAVDAFNELLRSESKLDLNHRIYNLWQLLIMLRIAYMVENAERSYNGGVLVCSQHVSDPSWPIEVKESRMSLDISLGGMSGMLTLRSQYHQIDSTCKMRDLSKFTFMVDGKDYQFRERSHP